MLAPILFFVLAIVAIAAALGMLIARSPVVSALWLVLNLFCIAGLYLTLNAEFIAVVQVIVYAGAIMVLFLFVIMLLNLGELPRLQTFDWKLGAAFIVGVGILAVLVYVVASTLEILPGSLVASTDANTGSAPVLARELYTRFALPFEIIGVLLLVATIGAVLLARRRTA
ncbi:MAG TPA: NADH-quinone oxidoreductase subunit J [Rhodothermales bacterium]